jgi:hypothetical protein
VDEGRSDVQKYLPIESSAHEFSQSRIWRHKNARSAFLVVEDEHRHEIVNVLEAEELQDVVERMIVDAFLVDEQKRVNAASMFKKAGLLALSSVSLFLLSESQ